MQKIPTVVLVLIIFVAFGALATGLSVTCALIYRATAPEVMSPWPADAIGPGTAMVWTANLTKLDHHTIQETLKTLMVDDDGRKVGVPTEMAKVIDQAEKLRDAGVEMTSVVVDGTGLGNGVVYLRLGAGASEANVQALMTADMPAPVKDQTQFTRAGKFLVMHRKDHAPPTNGGKSGDAAKAKLIDDAVTVVGAPITFVVLPSSIPQIGMMGMMAGGNQGAMTAVTSSKYIAGGFVPGNEPSVTLVIRAQDAAAAGTIKTTIEQAVQKAQQQMTPPAGSPQPPAAVQKKLEALQEVLANMEPVQHGDRVTIELESEALSTIINSGASPMMMGPMLGGGGMGAGGPGGVNAGPGAGMPSPVAGQDTATRMRRVTQAIIMCSVSNKMVLPNSLDEVRPFISSNPAEVDELLRHPVTGEAPGFIYIKPAGATKSSQLPETTTIILREAQNGQPKPGGLAGYLDGHVAPAP